MTTWCFESLIGSLSATDAAVSVPGIEAAEEGPADGLSLSGLRITDKLYHRVRATQRESLDVRPASPIAGQKVLDLFNRDIIDHLFENEKQFIKER